MTEIIEAMTSEPIPPTPFRPRFPGRLIERITGLGVPFQIAGEDNPIVRLDVKSIRWLKGDPRLHLHQMIGRWMRWAIISALLVLLADVFWLLASLGSPSPLTPNYYIERPSVSIITSVVLYSLLPTIVGSFYYMLCGLRAITPERESGTWEMIRLMPMSPENVQNAKYATVQIRAWRLLMMEYVPRFYILAGLLPSVVIATLADRVRDADYWVLRNWITWESLSAIILAFVLPMVYVLEAGWRMRTLTAIGLAISARSRNFTLNFVFGFFMLVVVHVAEVVGFFACTFILNTITPETPVFPLLVGGIIFVGLVNYLTLTSFHRVALNYARRNAFRDV